MPDKIKCTVSNCAYWENQMCKASAIEVNVDSGDTEAQSDSQTQCHTFKMKS
ncbi:MAG: DUF1540 domain-containing protein [Thermoanaerobacteraceae bacterium]|nr:DUF1540 domain-containing protein [Thermoanaerobacteraceae bacterium]